MPARPDFVARPRRDVVVARVLLVGAVALQLWGLYAPVAPGPPGIPGSDKLAHLGMFALVMAAGVAGRIPARPLAAVLVAHAVISEVVQGSLLPGRAGDPVDAVADIVGVGLGWLVGAWWVRTGRPRDRGPGATAG